MRHNWTLEQIEKLKARYSNTDTKKLANELGRSVDSLYYKANQLGLKKDSEFVAAEARERMSDPSHPGRKYLFEKGHISANKGRKQTEFMTPEAIERTKATRFKKGHRVWNYKPVGYERINRDRYIEVKTAEPNKFELKHRVVWRQHYGEIPAGHNVQFKDGNTRNCNIDNLYLISRAEQLRSKNSIHARYPEDLKKAILTLGALNRRIKKQEKQIQE